MRLIISVFFLLMLVGQPVYAVNPNEILKDPALEMRAREISKGLRCLVCQNQSIDDSDATLAKDLRVLVRDRITAGDTNEEVVTYVVSRYGDFVLLKPPFNMATLALWIGPFLLIIGGLIAIILFFRRNAKPAQSGSQPTPLSDEEKKRLAELLAENNR